MEDITIAKILYYFFENIEAVRFIMIVIYLLEIIGAILIFIGIMNIETRTKNLDIGQEQMKNQIETLEIECANINNNLKEILEEIRILNDKIPYQENEEDKYNSSNQQYRPNSGINDFKLYDNNR